MTFNRFMIILSLLWLVLGVMVAIFYYAPKFKKTPKQSNDEAVQMLSVAPYQDKHVDALVTDWTRSYQLYGYPHAIWLSGYESVGINQEKLANTLSQAKQKKQTPEIVIYSIPLRDLGQSSEGGFDNYCA